MFIIESRIIPLTIIIFVVMTLITIRARAQEETVNTLVESQPEPPSSEESPEAETAEAETQEPETPKEETVVNDDPPAIVGEDTQVAPKKEEQQTPSVNIPGAGHLTHEEIRLLILPDEVDAKEGYDPPTGYEEVVKPRTGLIAGGITMFLCSYIKMITIAGMTEEGKLAVPVIGTFLAMDELDELMPFFIMDVAAQGAGLIMAVVGASTKKKKWVRIKPEKAALNIAPTVLGKKSAGIGLTGTF